MALVAIITRNHFTWTARAPISRHDLALPNHYDLALRRSAYQPAQAVTQNETFLQEHPPPHRPPTNKAHFTLTSDQQSTFHIDSSPSTRAAHSELELYPLSILNTLSRLQPNHAQENTNPRRTKALQTPSRMDEPPAKRARRTDSSAMWERNETTASPRSPRLGGSEREPKPAAATGRSYDESGRRRKSRSRSPRARDGDTKDRHDRTRRSRSPRDRDRGYRDRERDSGRGRDDAAAARGGNSGRSKRDRSRSRSRDRGKTSKDYRSDRKRDRSRSPFRSGENAASTSTSTRQRSPARGARVKTEVRDEKRDLKNIKPVANGADVKMDVDDEDDADAMIRKMMGFSSFKTTQNTKVPGNQIYGVRKEKKTEYRQYMNRAGGFNRPLSPG